jgi:hypothetical protein
MQQGANESMGRTAVKRCHYAVSKLMLEAIALLSGGLIIVPTAVTMAAYIQRASQLPQLVDVNSRLGRHFLLATEARVAPTSDGGLLVQPESGHWPGISLDEVWPDWRGYSTLAVDLTNVGTQAFSIFVRIDDRRPDPRYKDRYNQQFQLAPQSRRVIRIPLVEIQSAPNGAPIDLAHMQKIMLFEDDSTPTYAFYLNSMRLER